MSTVAVIVHDDTADASVFMPAAAGPDAITPVDLRDTLDNDRNYDVNLRVERGAQLARENGTALVIPVQWNAVRLPDYAPIDVPELHRGPFSGLVLADMLRIAWAAFASVSMTGSFVRGGVVCVLATLFVVCLVTAPLAALWAAGELLAAWNDKHHSLIFDLSGVAISILIGLVAGALVSSTYRRGGVWRLISARSTMRETEARLLKIRSARHA